MWALWRCCARWVCWCLDWRRGCQGLAKWRRGWQYLRWCWTGLGTAVHWHGLRPDRQRGLDWPQAILHDMGWRGLEFQLEHALVLWAPDWMFSTQVKKMSASPLLLPLLLGPPWKMHPQDQQLTKLPSVLGCFLPLCQPFEVKRTGCSADTFLAVLKKGGERWRGRGRKRERETRRKGGRERGKVGGRDGRRSRHLARIIVVFLVSGRIFDCLRYAPTHPPPTHPSHTAYLAQPQPTKPQPNLQPNLTQPPSSLPRGS